MACITIKTQVGHLISLADYGISAEQIKEVHTVFNHNLAKALLSGAVDVDTIELGESHGTVCEVTPNILLDNQNRLHYYSLIPRKSDEVVVIIVLGDADLKGTCKTRGAQGRLFYPYPSGLLPKDCSVDPKEESLGQILYGKK